MSRTQYISHKLTFSPLLSPTEKALLHIINSRPQYCLENLETLAGALGRSKRTVQYVIDKLLSKGIIKRVYTTFKRMKIWIVSMAEQEKLLNGGVLSQVLKYCAFKKHKKNKVLSHDTQLVARPYTQLVAGSINRSNESKSIMGECLKKVQKTFLTDSELENEKQRQLLAFRQMLSL